MIICVHSSQSLDGRIYLIIFTNNMSPIFHAFSSPSPDVDAQLIDFAKKNASALPVLVNSINGEHFYLYTSSRNFCVCISKIEQFSQLMKSKRRQKHAEFHPSPLAYVNENVEVPPGRCSSFWMRRNKIHWKNEWNSRVFSLHTMALLPFISRVGELIMASFKSQLIFKSMFVATEVRIEKFF